MPAIYWAGDSTVQYNSEETFPQTGLGQVFDLFLKPDILVKNHAKNGRSTKSFMDEGRIAPIYDSITEGDFLFIQFGHNDEKKEDPSRYTDPDEEFMENLERFVNAARNKKANPVFITPVARRHFISENELAEDAHLPYCRAMKLMGERLQVPVIDLDTISKEMLIAAGEEKSREWYMRFPAGIYENYPEGSEDDTHLRLEGARRYAEAIAHELAKLGGIYGDLLAQA